MTVSPTYGPSCSDTKDKPERSEGAIFESLSRPATRCLGAGFIGNGRLLLKALLDAPTLGDIQDAVIAASQLKNQGTSFEEHCHFLLRESEPSTKLRKLLPRLAASFARALITFGHKSTTKSRSPTNGVSLLPGPEGGRFRQFPRNPLLQLI